ncbi:MAG TPA: DUF4349 domain-containing protein [Pilimelia sp.]|nr:DUF4349 domain-containing protein [Pilimelia sp.]
MKGVRFAAGLGAVGLALAVAVSGCSTNREDTGSTAGAPALDSQRDAPGAGAPAPGAAGKDAPTEPGGAGGRLAVDRAIIYTGSITVRVEDVDDAAAKATGIVTGAGGFVGADKRSRDDRRSEATLQLRVPAARFTGVVDQLAGLGEEEQRGIDTEDVTEAVIDLDARILTQQASVNRTRALLSRARTIGEIVSIESELAKREAELASLQAKKRRLADLTTLSTITLVLLGPDADAPKKEEPDTGFIAGVKAGWKAFLASMEVLLTVVGALLPWLLALGVPIYAIVWAARRLARRSRPAPAVVAAPAMAAGPAPTGPSPTRPAPVGPLPPPPPPRQTPPPPVRPTTQPPPAPPE